MAEPALKHMTVDEFFAWQERQDMNYELRHGVPVPTIKAMTGATRRHDRVTTAVLASLAPQLRGTPCEPLTADQSVRTLYGTRRPDIIVNCGEPETDRTLEAETPRVVIEVLSPSTIRADRFEKLYEYQHHPKIEVILLVEVERPSVAVWRREGDAWRVDYANGIDAVVDLPEIGASLRLADIYERLTFEETPGAV